MKRRAAIFLILCLVALGGHSEVIFIDADAVVPSTNQLVSIAPPPQSLQIQAAVVRFVPGGKATAFKGKLSSSASFSETIKALGKEGQVNLLYLGTRCLSWSTNDSALFTSFDRRPAFCLNEAANQALTNRQFGMELRVRARPAAEGQTRLDWVGNFSWSSDLIDLWAGDKYLMFGMRVAKLLKPGMIFSDNGDDDGDDSNQKGVNLRALFGKKKKEEKPAAGAPASSSFQGVDFQTVKLDGGELVSENHLVILSFPGRQDRNVSETVYVLLQPVLE